ncbi:hypothetical protein BJX99DRAFT_252811 [Aspergillus californicus]
MSLLPEAVPAETASIPTEANRVDPGAWNIISKTLDRTEIKGGVLIVLKTQVGAALQSWYEAKERANSGPPVRRAQYSQEQRMPTSTARSYANTVETLRDREQTATAVEGSGTTEDPFIIWLGGREPEPDRKAGCEKVCREACAILGVSIVWIRAWDHNTTQRLTRTFRNVQKTFTRCPPHLTVYMGNSIEFDYEGHIYCTYSSSDVPDRVVRPSEGPKEFEDSGVGIGVLDKTTFRIAAYDQGRLPLPPLARILIPDVPTYNRAQETSGHHLGRAGIPVSPVTRVY